MDGLVSEIFSNVKKSFVCYRISQKYKANYPVAVSQI